MHPKCIKLRLKVSLNANVVYGWVCWFRCVPHSLVLNGETVSFMQSLFIHQSTVAYPASSNETRNSYQWRVWRQQRRGDSAVTWSAASIQIAVALSVVLKKITHLWSKWHLSTVQERPKCALRKCRGSETDLTQVLNELQDAHLLETKTHEALSSSSFVQEAGELCIAIFLW